MSPATICRVKRKPVPAYSEFDLVNAFASDNDLLSHAEHTEVSYADLGLIDFSHIDLPELQPEKPVQQAQTPATSHRRLRSHTVQDFPDWMKLNKGSFLSTPNNTRRRRGHSSVNGSVISSPLMPELRQDDTVRFTSPFKPVSDFKSNEPSSSFPSRRTARMESASCSSDIHTAFQDRLAGWEMGAHTPCTELSTCGMTCPSMSYPSSSSLLLSQLELTRPEEPRYHYLQPIPPITVPDPIPFTISTLPTLAALEYAASLEVIAQSGVRVPFGSLWAKRKTIVVFIRHFFCPLCMDYCAEISRNVAPSVLHSANMELIIVSNGSFEMIKGYRGIFRMPFQIYTDPGLEVYKALGMTLQTMDAGPKKKQGSYVRHGLVSGIAMVVGKAIKVGMPIWKNGGTIPQLGGEYVLGPGMKCDFAHRMNTTRSHMPILWVMKKAGIEMYAPLRWITSIDEEEETKDDFVCNDSLDSLDHNSNRTAPVIRFQNLPSQKQELEALRERRRKRREGGIWTLPAAP